MGKVIEKQEKPAHDSLNRKINRDMADIHPDEMLRGEYTIQTDIFYLAEMFTRLLRDTQKEQFFSYSDILTKMKKYTTTERYQSFAEIKQAISTKEFASLEFTFDDKQKYQAFVSNVEKSISYYAEAPTFCMEPEDVISSLEILLQNSLLESQVQKVDDFIRCIVKSHLFYKPGEEIYIYVIDDFLKWFRARPYYVQKLVLSNMAYRLSKIKVKQDKDDIPF